MRARVVSSNQPVFSALLRIRVLSGSRDERAKPDHACVAGSLTNSV